MPQRPKALLDKIEELEFDRKHLLTVLEIVREENGKLRKENAALRKALEDASKGKR